MINNLNNDLGAIWACVIDKTNFDMFKNTITFKMKLVHIDSETIYNLIFKEVSSFFFVKNVGQLRFTFPEYEEGAFLELTSINYYENGVGEILINSKQNWPSEYNANSNFSLEMCGAHLFIEAGIVEINGKVYHTKN